VNGRLRRGNSESWVYARVVRLKRRREYSLTAFCLEFWEEVQLWWGNGGVGERFWLEEQGCDLWELDFEVWPAYVNTSVSLGVQMSTKHNSLSRQHYYTNCV
jgi:hypothetical protein